MMQVSEDHMLCTDCTQAAVNDCWDWLTSYADAGEDVEREQEVRDGLRSLGPNLCCGDSEKDHEFSGHPCDCCGTRLAGARHHFVTLEPTGGLDVFSVGTEHFANGSVARTVTTRAGVTCKVVLSREFRGATSVSWSCAYNGHQDAMGRDRFDANSSMDTFACMGDIYRAFVDLDLRMSQLGASRVLP